MYPNLIEGEVDPIFGKVVSYIVLDTPRFYVFLDPECEIQWNWHGPDDTATGFGKVMNRAAFLQSLGRFATGDNRKHFQRLIAEGIARFFDSGSSKEAEEMFIIVEREIRELSLKTSWQWYFNAGYGLTIICIIALFAAWSFRSQLKMVTGSTCFDVVFATLIGSVGALISVIARGDRITLDANAGLSLHITEGIARIVVGMCGAGLIALAFKSGIVAGGFFFKGSPFAALLVFSLVAGASERIVPSLINRVENIIEREKKAKIEREHE